MIRITECYFKLLEYEIKSLTSLFSKFLFIFYVNLNHCFVIDYVDCLGDNENKDEVK